MSEEINHNHTGPFARASMLLRKKKLTELFENRISANIIAQFGAKLDAKMDTMNAQLAVQSTKYSVMC